MKVLSSLTLGVADKADQDPVLVRRARLIQRLEQQKALAEDPNYTRTVSKRVRNEDGATERIDVQKKVRPWWKQDVIGGVKLSVRHGGKPVEFAKGKTAIVVASKEELPATIGTLIEAVRAGELDEQLGRMVSDPGALNRKRGT